MDRDLNDNLITWAAQDTQYNNDMLEDRKADLSRRQTAVAPGGVLSPFLRDDFIAARLDNSYGDAVDRACVAQQGLKTIYDFVVPDQMLPPPDDQEIDVRVSAVALWIRRATEWLVAYQQLDQAFTRVLSIAALSGNKWDDRLKATEQFRVSIQISRESFADHENVRLRGIGATILGDAGVIPWPAIVRLPKRAVYVRSAQPAKVDQSDLPVCLLGRIENKKSFRAPELCGLISLTRPAESAVELQVPRLRSG